MKNDKNYGTENNSIWRKEECEEYEYDETELKENIREKYFLSSVIQLKRMSDILIDFIKDDSPYKSLYRIVTNHGFDYNEFLSLYSKINPRLSKLFPKDNPYLMLYREIYEITDNRNIILPQDFELLIQYLIDNKLNINDGWVIKDRYGFNDGLCYTFNKISMKSNLSPARIMVKFNRGIDELKKYNFKEEKSHESN